MRRHHQTIEAKHPVIRPRWAEIEEAGDHLLVTCTDCNFVDADRIQRLHAILAATMTPSERNVVELDLRRVDHADMKLVAGLVAAARLARDCGVALTIRCSPRLRSLIGLCRLGDVLPVETA